MVERQPSRLEGKVTFLLVLSYIFDWIVIVVAAVVGYILGNIDPNKRPFSLENPDISFPYTLHETVPTYVLVIANTIGPIVIIFIIVLLFIPGSTVPHGTPQSLIWKRKLWELHAGWLGLALSLSLAWFITNGMKNLFGKPRPDLLDRCNPDFDHFEKYIVGRNFSTNGRLVSASICKNDDNSVLQDGFRSFPSGHASSSAAGLIYLSLFIASKFAITTPFLVSGSIDESSFSAFPSRMTPRHYDDAGTYEIVHVTSPRLNPSNNEGLASPNDPSAAERIAQHQAIVSAVRRQAAAPPAYLLWLALAPSFAAIFIASSRWFDFRHHGFDILFGFAIGTITAYFAFRFYHLPIGQGAGWAWAPRSSDKAWWAGVGTFSYATSRKRYVQPGDKGEEVIEPRGDSDGDGGVKRAGQSTGVSV